jgi:alcohol oxidase
MLWPYKKQREVARRMSHYVGAVEIGHLSFPEGSKASFQIADRNISEIKRDEIKDVEYAKEDDKVILNFLRENVNTS